MISIQESRNEFCGRRAVMKTIILIPAYEPDDKLVSLLKALSENDVHSVVVDDGSGHAYDEIFEECAKYASVTRYEVNCGKGHALKTGMAYIRKHAESPYVVVTADADGQHLPDDIMKIAEYTVQHPDELVLGSRRITAQTPLRSRIGNTVTRWIFRLSSGVSVYDTQTGLRGFSDRVISWMEEISGERYEYEMNVLMEWAKEKRSIHEIWIRTVYLDENRSSHFNTFTDSIRIYRQIVKFSGASLLSFLTDYSLFCMFHMMTLSAGIRNGLVLSNAAARVISASLNYYLNRKLVFRSKEPVSRSTLKYVLLVLGNLMVNTLILRNLVMQGVPSAVSKVVTELILFIVNYQVQQKLIFKPSCRKELSSQ